MTSQPEHNVTPQVHFKRRKLTHSKRVHVVHDGPAHLQPNDATTNEPTASVGDVDDAEEPVPNLKEIIRNRRRPRDRMREATRKVEMPITTEEAQVDAPGPALYTNRFVAQTGQVVDRDDTQMSEYIEARLAEQNHRQYGWPIPQHLQAAVVSISPDLATNLTATPSAHITVSDSRAPATGDNSDRLAAGRGKLEEVDLGPDATARIKETWKRLEKGEPEEEAADRKHRGKYGYHSRKPKRRNSEADRREKMVEAVLQEAKLDYFDDTTPATIPLTNNTGNNDEEVAERFRAEYFEAMENQQKRRKAPAPTTGTRGVKEPSRGPRLGGSKSARAKMHMLEKQAVNAKK